MTPVGKAVWVATDQLDASLFRRDFVSGAWIHLSDEIDFVWSCTANLHLMPLGEVDEFHVVPQVDSLEPS